MTTLPAAPKKNRRWIWYFVVVFALALLATVVLVVFNLRQQLKPEQLAAARKLWKEKGPANYTLAYATRVNHETEDHYWAKVRAGKVVEVKYNGQTLTERIHYHGMDGLFDDMERFMKIDSAKESPRTFVRAIFDDQKTGGLRWYVRSIMGERRRVEITVDTFTIDAPDN